MWIQAHAYIGLLSNDGRDSSRMAVTGVGQNEFVGMKLEVSEPLRGACPSGRGELETIAFQGAETRMFRGSTEAFLFPVPCSLPYSPRR